MSNYRGLGSSTRVGSGFIDLCRQSVTVLTIHTNYPLQGGCTEILTVQLLYDELREAELDWKILGHELALGHAVLREIEKEPTEERRKRSVLEKWWDRRKEHCWQSIFEALYEVGKPVLADQLAKKYGAGSKKHEGTASPYVHER